MPVQPIRLFGDPVLRTPAEPVRRLRQGAAHARRGPAGDHARRARRRAWRLRRSGSACGSSPTTSTTRSGHLVNPILDLPTRRRRTTRAACPSPAWPSRPCGRTAWSPRASNMHGEPVTIEGTELLARCVQHETDHLDGILFIDRLDQAQRKAALKAIREAEWAGETAPAGQAVPARDARPSALSAGSHAPRLRRHPRGRRPGAGRPARLRRTRSSPCSPARTPRPAAAAARPRRRWRRRAAEAGIETLKPARAARPGVCSTGCASSRRTAARSSRTARWCRAALLDLPPHGWVNLHFSLLPAWRGAAPVQHAILHGDDVTGATIFQLEEGLDTGPVLRRMTEPIAPARHQRRPARPARRAPAPGCWSPPSTPSSAASWCAQPQPADGVSLAPKLDRRGRPGRLVAARLPRRPAGPGLHPGARGLDHLGRRAARARPGRAGRRRRGAGRRARSGWRRRGRAGRHRRRPGGPARRGAPGRRAADGRRRAGRAACATSTARGCTDVDRAAARRASSAARRAAASRGRTPPRRVAFDAAPRGRRARRLRQPHAAGAAARPRPRRPRRGVRHRARLRHAARPGQYDAVLAACVDRPLDQVDGPVLDVLRLGAHQLLADAGARRTPRWAPPSSWPARSRGRAAASFVNAVLRRVGRQDLAGWLAEVAPPLRRRPGRSPRGRALAPALGGLGAARRARRLAARRRPRCSPPTTPRRR